MGIENKIEDWGKLSKLKTQIDKTSNEERRVDLIRTFMHQADLYKTKYHELYSPATPPK